MCFSIGSLFYRYLFLPHPIMHNFPEADNKLQSPISPFAHIDRVRPAYFHDWDFLI